MKTAPEAVSFPMSHLSGQGNSFSSARAASGFALTVSIVNQASGPIISFSSSVTKTFSIFRIGRVSFGLFLAGKMFHREAVSFDSPPIPQGVHVARARSAPPHRLRWDRQSFPVRLPTLPHVSRRAKINFYLIARKVAGRRIQLWLQRRHRALKFCMSCVPRAPIASPGDSQGSGEPFPCRERQPRHRKSENPDNSGS